MSGVTVFCPLFKNIKQRLKCDFLHLPEITWDSKQILKCFYTNKTLKISTQNLHVVLSNFYEFNNKIEKLMIFCSLKKKIGKSG